ncbi:DUF1737 domain-containing protein [Yunchengibacter salinarum]|uniref:DUF1737 domain-containing protein n=1 Tax=Yunchengibacter salinarum TaxID=3133399 RepID=UPI0035B66404
MADDNPKKYRFITGEDDDRFCQRVSDALEAGYSLYGEPRLVAMPDGRLMCGQAVIRD